MPGPAIKITRVKGPKSAKALEKEYLARRAMQTKSGQAHGYNPYRDAHGKFAKGPHKAKGTATHAAAAVGAFTRARKLATARAAVQRAAAPAVKAHEAVRAKAQGMVQAAAAGIRRAQAKPAAEAVMRARQRAMGRAAAKPKPTANPQLTVKAHETARVKVGAKYQAAVQRAKPTTAAGAKEHLERMREDYELKLKRLQNTEKAVALGRASKESLRHAQLEHDRAHIAHTQAEKLHERLRGQEEKAKAKPMAEAVTKARQAKAATVKGNEKWYSVLYSKGKRKAAVKKAVAEKLQKAETERKAKAESEAKRVAETKAKAEAEMKLHAEMKAHTEKIHSEYKQLETKAKKEINAKVNKADLGETRSEIKELTKQEDEIKAKQSKVIEEQVDYKIKNKMSMATRTHHDDEYEALSRKRNDLNYKLYVLEGIEKRLTKREVKAAKPMAEAFTSARRKLSLESFYAHKKLK